MAYYICHQLFKFNCNFHTNSWEPYKPLINPFCKFSKESKLGEQQLLIRNTNERDGNLFLSNKLNIQTMCPLWFVSWKKEYAGKRRKDKTLNEIKLIYTGKILFSCFNPLTSRLIAFSFSTLFSLLYISSNQLLSFHFVSALCVPSFRHDFSAAHWDLCTLTTVSPIDRLVILSIGKIRFHWKVWVMISVWLPVPSDCDRHHQTFHHSD